MSAVAGTEEFPWGDRAPEGGYRVGDRVGIIHSDHEDYVFDNPTGVVIKVEEVEHDNDEEVFHVDEVFQRVTVRVDSAPVGNDDLFLIARAGTWEKPSETGQMGTESP